MNAQQGLILTKKVENITYTLGYNSIEKRYIIYATDGEFTNGKGAFYSNGTPINQPSLGENYISFSRSEVKRLGTYMSYHNGINVKYILFGNWIDRNGVNLSFANDTDIYYYFNRMDCGIVPTTNGFLYHFKYHPHIINILHK